MFADTVSVPSDTSKLKLTSPLKFSLGAKLYEPSPLSVITPSVPSYEIPSTVKLSPSTSVAPFSRSASVKTSVPSSSMLNCWSCGTGKSLIGLTVRSAEA